MGRDPAESDNGGGLYVFALNTLRYDLLGLMVETMSFVVNVNEREEYVFVGYAPGSFIANQRALYQKQRVFDRYEVTLQYSKKCVDCVPIIHPLRMTGNLLYQFDDTSYSLSLYGLSIAGGERYFARIEGDPTDKFSYNKTKLTTMVVIEVVRERFVSPGFSIGPLSFSGGTLMPTEEVVGRKSITLKHSCE